MNDKVSTDKLQGEYRTVGLFIDNAKTYIQLSTGALLLSVTFSQSISGDKTISINEPYLMISWLLWLGAIILGVTYQYCAVKYLEAFEGILGLLCSERVKPIKLLQPWAKEPYRLYGALLFCFYVGTIWFAAYASVKLV